MQSIMEITSHTTMGNHLPYGSHSVTCHLSVVTFTPLPQPKPVLNLATPEGCKAELTCVVVISQYSLPQNTVKYLRNNWKVTWLGIEPATESRKSNVPPSHQCSKISWADFLYSVCIAYIGYMHGCIKTTIHYL